MRLSMEGASVDLGGRRVLKDVTLEFPVGTVTALLGPNGAGKSTLLKSLAGLIPMRSGLARVGDDDVHRLSRREAARRVAYLAQGTEAPFAFPVRELVLMARYAHLGRFEPEGPADHEAVEKALATVNALDLADRPVGELSGGERQRVLLARTLATGAPCLILDEPVANLDIRHCLDLLEIFKNLAAEGRTLVVAIHDLNLASLHCDRFALLHEGRVLGEGLAEKVLSPQLIRQAYSVEARRHVGDDHSFFTFSRRDTHG
ncbi:MAG: ABC transporter ATP-binding protein [Planctomycetota bacterium]